MLKNTFPYSNNRHIRQLPNILKINLHTRLDDGKDPKPEINDKTKNELKEKIKNELEKDLKFEIDDKTKNELKEKIKNELEKDPKFGLDDKTKDEIKDKTKKEIEDEIDFKKDGKEKDGGDDKDGYDKDGYNKKGFDEDGYDRTGFDKDGFDKDGFDKDGYNKKGFDEDGYDRTGFDKDGYDKNGFDRKGFDEDGYDRTGFDKDGFDKDGFDKDGFDKDGFDKDGYNKKGFDEDGYDRTGFDKDGYDKNGFDRKGGREFIEGILITKEHADPKKCGIHAVKYELEEGGHIGKVGWFTKDLLEQFLPELMSKKEILENFDSKSNNQYHAENFGITFSCQDNKECGKNMNFTFAVPSNMLCNKGGQIGNAGLLCRDEIRSINKSSCCSTPAPYGESTYSENFFLNDQCPNLILDLKEEELKKCAGKTVVARLEVPMVIVDQLGFIIDKSGQKIPDFYYFQLKDRLNYKGEIKDSSGKTPEILAKAEDAVKRSLWVSDKEVKLKIPDALSYSPGANDNEDNSVFADTHLI